MVNLLEVIYHLRGLLRCLKRWIC